MTTKRDSAASRAYAGAEGLGVGDRLERAAIQALADDPLDGSGVITLSRRLDVEVLSGSVVATRGAMMLVYAREHDGIGLTKSGALNRKFLHGATTRSRSRAMTAASDSAKKAARSSPTGVSRPRLRS